MMDTSKNWWMDDNRHRLFYQSEEIVEKAIKLYPKVISLVEERWKQFFHWNPVIERPSWLEGEVPDFSKEKLSKEDIGVCDRLTQISIALQSFESFKHPVDGIDFICTSIFNTDCKDFKFGFKFLSSGDNVKAWRRFYKKLNQVGYGKVFPVVLELYRAYHKYCQNEIGRSASFKALSKTEGYKDFENLIPAAIFSIRGGIAPELYVEVLYNSFLNLSKSKGEDWYHFTTAHIGTTSSVRPPESYFKTLKVNRWDKIIKFLGLAEDVKIKGDGIPLGFTMSAYHEAHGGSMKDIGIIFDTNYWDRKGNKYTARYHHSDCDPFAIWITPSNFDEFKDQWFEEPKEIPSYELLQQHGNEEISPKRYEYMKKNYEKMFDS